MSTKAKKQEDRSVLAQELEYFEQNREEFLRLRNNFSVIFF